MTTPDNLSASDKHPTDWGFFVENLTTQFSTMFPNQGFTFANTYAAEMARVCCAALQPVAFQFAYHNRLAELLGWDGYGDALSYTTCLTESQLASSIRNLDAEDKTKLDAILAKYLPEKLLAGVSTLWAVRSTIAGQATLHNALVQLQLPGFTLADQVTGIELPIASMTGVGGDAADTQAAHVISVAATRLVEKAVCEGANTIQYLQEGTEDTKMLTAPQQITQQLPTQFLSPPTRLLEELSDPTVAFDAPTDTQVLDEGADQNTTPTEAPPGLSPDAAALLAQLLEQLKDSDSDDKVSSWMLMLSQTSQSFTAFAFGSTAPQKPTEPTPTPTAEPVSEAVIKVVPEKVEEERSPFNLFDDEPEPAKSKPTMAQLIEENRKRESTTKPSNPQERFAAAKRTQAAFKKSESEPLFKKPQHLGRYTLIAAACVLGTFLYTVLQTNHISQLDPVRTWAAENIPSAPDGSDVKDFIRSALPEGDNTTDSPSTSPSRTRPAPRLGPKISNGVRIIDESVKYEYADGYKVTVQQVEFTDKAVLVTFDATGKRDLRTPERSCVYEDGVEHRARSVDLSVNEKGHYKGVIVFDRNRYEPPVVFNYACIYPDIELISDFGR